MSYDTSTIGDLIDRVNRTHFLPAIQRPYVWKPEQILLLFDSIMKGYPISSFLFWQIDDDRKRDLEVYRFIENYRVGDTLNELAETAGRDVVLVLDGQQRLTSLLIGLRGTLLTKERYTRKGNPDNWTRNRLYLDLLQDPEAVDEAEDGDVGLTWGFAFHATEPRPTVRKLWFRVADILSAKVGERYLSLRQHVLSRLPAGATSRDQEIVGTSLDRLHEAIWRDPVIAYFTETDQSQDRVLDIFIRANDAGTKLNKSDLFLSLVTSHWRSVNAREEIHGFVERANGKLGALNAINKDFVLKASLVLCDIDVRFRLQNMNAGNLARIEEAWDRIKTALERTLKLVNGFGLDRTNLTSANALLPIAYFLYRTDQDLMGTTEEERRTSLAIQRWLVQALLTGAFAGSSDRTIASARSMLQRLLVDGRGFALDPMLRAISLGGRTAMLTDYALDDLLHLTYRDSKTFLALSLLYDRSDWGRTRHEMDHIIPRSVTDRRKLMQMNLPESRIRQIEEAANRIGNLQLILDRENREKSDMPFHHWIGTRNAEFLKEHLIPDDRDLWQPERLPEFVAERERMIRKRLETLGG